MKTMQTQRLQLQWGADLHLIAAVVKCRDCFQDISKRPAEIPVEFQDFK